MIIAVAMRRSGLLAHAGAEIKGHDEKKNKNPQNNEKRNAALTRDVH
jgi:hypothetical protein